MTESTLTRLYSRDFRNLEELSWQPGQGRHLLLGDNGAGKTSLLEALYVLATTRSFRASRLADCARHDTESFRLGGEIAGDARTELELVLGPEGTSRRLNGSPASLQEHLSVLPLVAWTAADLEWISGAPAARRRLIDRGVVGLTPAAIVSLSRYRRALEHKRALLAHRETGLEAWNEVLAEAADDLIRRRRAHVEALSEALAELLEECEIELPSISLTYRPSPANGGRGLDETLAAIESHRSSEVDRRSPLVGPHRDELDIRWGGHGARKVASAGERKLLGLAITAASARLLAASGRTPVLLLDDLDAALDSRRLGAVWSFFEPFEQLFVTSNRAAVWERFDLSSAWNLTCGKLSPR